MHSTGRKNYNQEKFSGHLVTLFSFSYSATIEVLQNLVILLGQRRKKCSNFYSGSVWMKLLLKRPDLTQRCSQNLSQARDCKDQDTIKQYFDNFEIQMQDVPASNIYNYDESKLLQEHQISKKIRHSFKGCTSLMI